MDESTVTPLLASAALVAPVLALMLLIAVAEPRAAGLRAFMVDHPQVPVLAVAGVAMAGSLYYSESVGFVPCEFCWYQRIAMYPIAVMALVAVATRQRLPARYPVAIAFIGLALSVYHYQLQLNPEQSTVCSSGVPCTVQYVDEFGFISIPFMAGCGFVAILLSYAAQWRARRVEAAVAETWEDELAEAEATT